MKINKVNALLLLLAVSFLVYVIFFFDKQKPIRLLPVFGPKTYEAKSGKTDTVFHTIAPFSFVNQDGKAVTQNDFKDAVYVTDFFFTTCHSICPVMSTQMERLYQHFKGNKEVMFLSHTVDPDVDTVAQLKQYALRHNADAPQWMFVTGDKKDLYAIARNSYMLDAEQGDGGPDDFIHTQNFALIDKDKRIRGYYDGTDSIEINKLQKDIELLLQEYQYKNKQ
jgi:protein SCO1